MYDYNVLMEPSGLHAEETETERESYTSENRGRVHYSTVSHVVDHHLMPLNLPEPETVSEFSYNY